MYNTDTKKNAITQILVKLTLAYPLPIFRLAIFIVTIFAQVFSGLLFGAEPKWPTLLPIHFHPAPFPFSFSFPFHYPSWTHSIFTGECECVSSP